MFKLKVQKLEKLIEKELSRIFLSEVKDDVGFLTITGVDLTNDLSLAKVYYTVLGNEEKRAAVAKRLEKAKGFVRTALSSRIHIKKIPDLTFIYDESIEYGNKIEKLIKEIHEKE